MTVLLGLVLALDEVTLSLLFSLSQLVGQPRQLLPHSGQLLYTACSQTRSPFACRLVQIALFSSMLRVIRIANRSFQSTMSHSAEKLKLFINAECKRPLTIRYIKYGLSSYHRIYISKLMPHFMCYCYILLYTIFCIMFLLFDQIRLKSVNVIQRKTVHAFTYGI